MDGKLLLDMELTPGPRISTLPVFTYATEWQEPMLRQKAE